ncbi:hypothetical protein [Nocardia sp. NPDC052566]|uniref:hypothetical protein n=1 Tax=Nocardia sp. NPDC052566 TaxID=3364330 RepID=UPI0037C7E40F
MPEFSGSELPFGRVQMTKRVRARLRRVANQGTHSGTARNHGWRRSEVDEQVLDFAGRFGALTLRQVAEHFYGGVFATAKERVSFMAHAGLLERSDNLRWAGTIVYPTAAGLTVARAVHHPELRGMTPGEGRMLHRLLVADSALRMHRRRIVVVSERQSRALEHAIDDGRRASAFAELCGVAVAAAGGGVGVGVRPSRDADDRMRWWGIPVGEELHWADFFAVVQGRLIAVEVEVTLKERWRVLQVVRGYKQALDRGHLAQVLWQVTADVQMQLEGHRGPHGWEDGLLQDVGLLPSGVAPDWTVKGSPMVVRPIEVADEGVRYALSQKLLVPSLRSSYREWTRRRQLWSESGTALAFEDWLMQPKASARAGIIE